MKKLLPLLVVFLFSLPSLNCSSPSSVDDSDGGGNGGGSNNIVTTRSHSVLIGTIGAAGGVETVNAPGEPLDGMTIAVPGGAYDAAFDFDISYAPIVSHDLGEYFDPVGPLIRVTTTTGAFADSIMTLAIPISIDSGSFAMAWAYDEFTGEVEGLPLFDLTNDRITIGTRHFATSNIYGGSSQGKSLLRPDDLNSYMNILISRIPESELAAQGVIASGFSPGRDDWEFVNRGSFIAPGGHCAGQAMTALWYYSTIKSPQLFGLLDTEPGISPDNRLGYRFASTVQKDSDFLGWANAMGWTYALDRVSFNAFAASILQTGEPQSVLIRNSAGDGGHAMIIYKVDYNSGILYVADPNYPGNRHFSTGEVSVRQIKFANGKFEPYITGLRADKPGVSMDQIGYSGKSAFIDWAHISNRWQEVQSGTIGNDRFPAAVCSLEIKGHNGVYLAPPVMHVGNDSINLWIRMTGIPNANLGRRLYRGTERVPLDLWIPLQSGGDRLGMEMLAKVGNDYEWVDFQYTTYFIDNVRIEPALVVGQKG
ncbi:MAG: hypothetical protein HKN20_08165, partial [Gemmatimonadetes bacterium]|nr:hypothetical protein [Gemmatimonadota bacterium]